MVLVLDFHITALEFRCHKQLTSIDSTYNQLFIINHDYLRNSLYDYWLNIFEPKVSGRTFWIWSSHLAGKISDTAGQRHLTSVAARKLNICSVIILFFDTTVDASQIVFKRFVKRQVSFQNTSETRATQGEGDTEMLENRSVHTTKIRTWHLHNTGLPT